MRRYVKTGQNVVTYSFYNYVITLWLTDIILIMHENKFGIKRVCLEWVRCINCLIKHKALHNENNGTFVENLNMTTFWAYFFFLNKIIPVRRVFHLEQFMNRQHKVIILNVNDRDIKYIKLQMSLTFCRISSLQMPNKRKQLYLSTTGKQDGLVDFSFPVSPF